MAVTPLSQRSHRPGGHTWGQGGHTHLRIWESLSSACLSAPLPPSAAPRAPSLRQVAFLTGFFFLEAIPSSSTHNIHFPPNPHGTGDLRRQKRLMQESGTIQLLLVNTELLHWQLLPARQHMHWNKEKPRQHRRFIKAWFPAKPLQLGRGHGARHFRAALPGARQQQTHAQPWPCWQLVPISLLGQISPRCWGWKRVLQSPAPDSTSGVWGPGYLLGSLSAGQGVFLERFPSAVHLSQARGACSAA